MSDPAAEISNLYALLIGVDCYLPNRLPNGGSYHSLNGCVRDIRHVEEYLTSRLRLPRERILKLTASNAAGDFPAEPAGQWPTYENMAAQFQQLTALAQAGDQVYIHYSGHGGRASTIYPGLKGAGGLDEALVPANIGNPGARYLRDVELAYLLRAMVDKGLIVTVVLDSCHSGGATRGMAAAVARGISEIDTTPRPADSLIAPTWQLAALWQAEASATRAAKPASGWLLEPKGYTLFAACRASESAYEYPFNGNEKNGALTYWLLDSLRQAGPGFSAKVIFDRILAKVHGQFDRQTPQLQGEGNRPVFSSNWIQPFYAVPLLKVDPTGRVLLNAGEAHGLQTGAQFAIYPASADFSQETQRLALAEVDQIGPVDAWATIFERYSFLTAPIEPGCQAVLLNVANVRQKRTVAVVIEDPWLREKMEATILHECRGFVTLARQGEAVDFQVAINDEQEIELWDPAGAALPNLRPAVKITDAQAFAQIAARLVHLAKYRNVQDLDMPDPAMRAKLEVELAGAVSAAESGGAPIFQPGDRVKLRIKNTQQPNPANPNDPARILNVTVLDLGADWGITQIYPAEAGVFEPLDPGQMIEPEFEAYLPEGYTESLDVIKVFATRTTTSFRWLELPALDAPDTRAMKMRSFRADPLEQMLAGLTTENATRGVRLASAPKERSWTVAQVELRVRR